MRKWEDWFFALLLVLCVIGAVVTTYLPLPVTAAPFEPMATVTPVPPCQLWRMAGDQKIYKCVDDEAPWATCYQPAGGVLQCLKE